MMDEQARYDFVQNQIKAMKKGQIIWWIIIVIQGCITLGTLAAIVGFIVLVMFILNIIFNYIEYQYYKSVESCGWEAEEVILHFKKIKKRSMIMLVPNLLFGAGIGCIGNIYDLVMVNKALKQEKEILGAGADSNASKINEAEIDWDHCAICNKEEGEEVGLYHLKDGSVCSDCLASHEGLFPQRAEKSIYVKGKSRAHFVHMDIALLKLSVNEVKNRLDNYKKNQEMYSNFSPTKVMCDGCLELDENNSLFRIVGVWNDDFTSTKNGIPSGLIHPYSEVTGICYEMIYHYSESYDDDTHTKTGSWVYTDCNSIVFTFDSEYISEESFMLKRIETSLFNLSKKPHKEFAEKTINELHEILGAPILPAREIENRNFSYR